MIKPNNTPTRTKKRSEIHKLMKDRGALKDFTTRKF